MKLQTFIILLLVLVGAGSCHGEQKKSKADIQQIHEQEVQKAIKELKAEKQERKKKGEERKKILSTQKAECKTLEAKLREVNAQKGAALAELDDIRRPHLFRSRSKKEAQLSEQMQRIDKLEMQAASLKKRIAKCKTAIDSLSAE
jgi:chromosome segregation ATPase